MIAPGSTIGILGGGQLGRMLAMAAAQLGYRCHVFSPEADSVAGEVSAEFTCAGWHDHDALMDFARHCAVVTYEFENVPVAPLAALPEGVLRPGTRPLDVAQDRWSEKRFVESLGGRAAAYAAIHDDSEVMGVIDRIGAPGVLKTRSEGYDGKGQWRIGTDREAEGLRVPRQGLIYEALVPFEAEFSVLLVRGEDGEVRFWQSPHNTHEDGILATSTLPPPAIVAGQQDEARALAAKVAEALGYIGVMAFEFFATAQGPVFNEMAPRVHNSGHWTLEGAVTSQFENHIRAICGLPLGDTATLGSTVTMSNLVGTSPEAMLAELADPAAHLHIYGKAEAREGRKMGHVTRITP